MKIDPTPYFANHKYDVKKAWLLSIIVKRSKIISVGFNKRMQYWPNRFTKHSEHDVLDKAGIRAKGADLFIFRLKRDGSFGMARPCKNCFLLIKKAGIVNIEYTNGIDGMTKERVL